MRGGGTLTPWEFPSDCLTAAHYSPLDGGFMNMPLTSRIQLLSVLNLLGSKAWNSPLIPARMRSCCPPSLQIFSWVALLSIT